MVAESRADHGLENFGDSLYPYERYGRHDWTRTSDLYRVNFEVNNLKPFACLAFPQTTYLKTPRKRPIFGDELVTSFLFLRRKEIFSAQFRVAAEPEVGDNRALKSGSIRHQLVKRPVFAS